MLEKDFFQSLIWWAFRNYEALLELLEFSIRIKNFTVINVTVLSQMKIQATNIILSRL